MSARPLFLQSLRRSIAGPLLLGLAGLFGGLPGLAAAQPVALTPEDTADASALQRAMPALARALLAQAGEPSAGPPTEADWAQQARLRLMAGQPAEALEAVERLRALQAVRPRAPDAPPALLAFELHARALLAGGSDFDAALAEQYHQRFAGLNDRQAQRAAIGLRFDPGRAWPFVQRAVAGLRFEAGTVPREQALALVAAYAPTFVFGPLQAALGAAIEADDTRRYVREQHRVHTPDGAQLVVHVVRPRAAAELPAALQFTIYAEAAPPWRELVLGASHGYASVLAYSRGKGGSPGPVEPYLHEARDVNVVIDWLARQPWSNGSVGMYGGSYNGFAQWAALKQPHPALKTIVPYVAAMPGQGLPMENNVMLTANYAWPFYVTGGPHLDDALYNDHERWNRLAERWFESGRPFREIDRIDGPPNPWLQRWLLHPTFDAYWQRLVPWSRHEYARIHIPVLSITGYYDDGQISAIEYLSRHEAHHPGPQHHLVIGPYDHVGAQRPVKTPVLRGYTLEPSAQFDTLALTFAWFDHVLRGAARPALLKQRIAYQVMGADRWGHAPSLQALQARPTRWHLQPAALPGQAHALGRTPGAAARVLSHCVDLADRRSSSIDYYPNPILRPTLGPGGQVLVSEPLGQDQVLAGRFSARLRMSLNRRDADLVLVLYELTPEGQYLHLAYHLGRASHAADLSRRRLFTPGVPRWVDFTRTRMVARQLRAGSRLVLHLDINKNSGAQVNMGTGGDVSGERASDARGPTCLRVHPGSWLGLPLQAEVPELSPPTDRTAARSLRGS